MDATSIVSNRFLRVNNWQRLRPVTGPRVALIHTPAITRRAAGASRDSRYVGAAGLVSRDMPSGRTT
jgi:hypothetical protein